MTRIKQLRIDQIKDQCKSENYAAKYPSPQEVAKQTGNSNKRNSKLMKYPFGQVIVTNVGMNQNIQQELSATRKLSHSNSSSTLFPLKCSGEVIEESKNNFSSPNPSPTKSPVDYRKYA